MISWTLKAVVDFCGPDFVFAAKYVSTCFLYAAGNMDLHCTGIYSNTIELIGCWYSDEMIRYLHFQANPIMHNFSSLMVNHGIYTLLPTHEAPCY